MMMRNQEKSAHREMLIRLFLLPSQSRSGTPWIKAFHQGQEKKATAIALVTASEPADGTNPPRAGGCLRCGNRHVVGYGFQGRGVGDGDTGWGSCLERHTSEGESPDPQPLRSSVVRALGCHESGCLGLQLHAGWYTSFKAAGMMNIRTGPTAHK